MNPWHILLIVLTLIFLVLIGTFLYRAIAIAGMRRAGVSEDTIDKVLRH